MPPSANRIRVLTAIYDNWTLHSAVGNSAPHRAAATPGPEGRRGRAVDRAEHDRVGGRLVGQRDRTVCVPVRQGNDPPNHGTGARAQSTPSSGVHIAQCR